MDSFADILKMVQERTRNQDVPEVKVTPDCLRRKATAMAERGYMFDEVTLKALEWYLKGYGLLLSGAVGVGKTYFFKKLHPDPLPILSFNQCPLWTYEQLANWMEEHHNEEIVVDDIGWDKSAGDGLSRNYGQKYDALQIVLDYRLHSPHRTHFTTNLDYDGLKSTYDAHLIDRIYELARPVKMNAYVSRRKAKPNAFYVRYVMAKN